ncbi:hypothetical protein SASPL_130794 [Salvia splendens]|uniref:RRM domain-containing protein n=1 Tax=Salvia splendens TaxID=180675 RepID=A0A8X8X6C7_SALSN|nr:hypothetical protein SASPL_130794 [Salvia splendens]
MEQSKNPFAGPSKAPFMVFLIKRKLHGNFRMIPELNFSESERVRSIDDGFPSRTKGRVADEVKDPLEDIEPHTMGNLLPGDEDELFAGLMDDFDLSGLPTQLEELDDDFFGSGGGLEIESESHENLINGISRLSMSEGISGSTISPFGFTNGVAAVSGEHPYGEHPSRTLFVRNINSNVEDSELKSLFEQFGDIRTLYTACKHRGFVMISYYDIRAARTAMPALQSKPLRRRKLDIHFSIPKDNPSEKDVNQGTLVVFNLDASVSNDDLRQIFGAYGEVKEIRETPHKRHHKFIEFYDVRAADAALKALNRSDIAGKRIKLEPSRPGGARRSLMQQLSQEQDQDEARLSFTKLYDAKVRKSESCGEQPLNGLASILPSHASNPVKIAPIGKDPGRMTQNQVVNKANNGQGVAFQDHYSIPDPNLSSSPGPVSPFDYSKPSSIGTLSGPQFLWGSPSVQSDHANSSAWSSSLKARPFQSSGQGIGFPYPSQRGSFLGSHHHVGSAPSGIQLERHLGFFPDSPETSYINQAAFGVTNFGRNGGSHGMNIGVPGAVNVGVTFAGNYTDSGSPGSRVMSMTRNGPLYYGNSSFGATNNDGMIDRARSRRVESGGQMDNKKQYQLDLEKIMSGEDSRTTLMIKNIPNKYTSKMLLAAIDETHKGTYDFLYLPIDFKNSSLMNEDKRCRPIVFQSESQGTGDLELFPSGNLNIFIRQPDGSYLGDSLDSPRGDSDIFGS